MRASLLVAAWLIVAAAATAAPAHSRADRLRDMLAWVSAQPGADCSRVAIALRADTARGGDGDGDGDDGGDGDGEAALVFAADVDAATASPRASVIVPLSAMISRASWGPSLPITAALTAAYEGAAACEAADASRDAAAALGGGVRLETGDAAACSPALARHAARLLQDGRTGAMLGTAAYLHHLAFYSSSAAAAHFAPYIASLPRGYRDDALGWASAAGDDATAAADRMARQTPALRDALAVRRAQLQASVDMWAELLLDAAGGAQLYEPRAESDDGPRAPALTHAYRPSSAPASPSRMRWEREMTWALRTAERRAFGVRHRFPHAALIPVLDMANHRSEPPVPTSVMVLPAGCSADVDGDGNSDGDGDDAACAPVGAALPLPVANGTLAAGSEVLNTYHDAASTLSCAADMLVVYGFVATERSARCAAATLTRGAGNVTSVVEGGRDAALRAAGHDPRGTVAVVFRDGAPLAPSLIGALRAASVDGDDVRLLASGGHSSAPNCSLPARLHCPSHQCLSHTVPRRPASISPPLRLWPSPCCGRCSSSACS